MIDPHDLSDFIDAEDDNERPGERDATMVAARLAHIVWVLLQFGIESANAGLDSVTSRRIDGYPHIGKVVEGVFRPDQGEHHRALSLAISSSVV